VIWVAFAVFVVAQAAMMFAFYRKVLRPLPAQINELLFERHLKNEFTAIDSDTAELVRVKLLELEEERLEAIARYEAVKGKRLNTTEKAERDGIKKAVSRLTSQIDGLRKQLDSIYGAPVLSHLRRFEEVKLVSAINNWLDANGSLTRR